jgi:hypothetical protein
MGIRSEDVLGRKGEMVEERGSAQLVRLQTYVRSRHVY